MWPLLIILIVAIGCILVISIFKSYRYLLFLIPIAAAFFISLYIMNSIENGVTISDLLPDMVIGFAICFISIGLVFVLSFLMQNYHSRKNSRKERAAADNAEDVRARVYRPRGDAAISQPSGRSYASEAYRAADPSMSANDVSHEYRRINTGLETHVTNEVLVSDAEPEMYPVDDAAAGYNEEDAAAFYSEYDDSEAAEDLVEDVVYDDIAEEEYPGDTFSDEAYEESSVYDETVSAYGQHSEYSVKEKSADEGLPGTADTPGYFYDGTVPADAAFVPTEDEAANEELLAEYSDAESAGAGSHVTGEEEYTGKSTEENIGTEENVYEEDVGGTANEGSKTDEQPGAYTIAGGSVDDGEAVEEYTATSEDDYVYASSVDDMVFDEDDAETGASEYMHDEEFEIASDTETEEAYETVYEESVSDKEAFEEDISEDIEDGDVSLSGDSLSDTERFEEPAADTAVYETVEAVADDMVVSEGDVFDSAIISDAESEGTVFAGEDVSGIEDTADEDISAVEELSAESSLQGVSEVAAAEDQNDIVQEDISEANDNDISEENMLIINKARDLAGKGIRPVAIELYSQALVTVKNGSVYRAASREFITCCIECGKTDAAKAHILSVLSYPDLESDDRRWYEMILRTIGA